MQCMAILGFLAAQAASATDYDLQYQDNVIWVARAIEVGERALKQEGLREKELEHIKNNLRTLKDELAKVGTAKINVSVEIHSTSKEELNGQSGERACSSQWYTSRTSGTATHDLYCPTLTSYYV